MLKLQNVQRRMLFRQRWSSDEGLWHVKRLWSIYLSDSVSWIQGHSSVCWKYGAVLFFYGCVEVCWRGRKLFWLCNPLSLLSKGRMPLRKHVSGPHAILQSPLVVLVKALYLPSSRPHEVWVRNNQCPERALCVHSDQRESECASELETERD